MLCHLDGRASAFPLIQSQDGSVTLLGHDSASAIKGPGVLTVLRGDTVFQLHGDQMQVMDRGRHVTGDCTDMTSETVQLIELLSEAGVDQTLQVGGIIPEQQSDAPQGNSGPPMTSGELNQFYAAVQQCWNVGSLSASALRTTVTVSVSMTEDARPIGESMRLVSYDGGSAQDARQAFESARRAIIRCGADGFKNLPPDKFNQWRDIELTFNPENMRIR